MEYRKWEKGGLRRDGKPGFDTPSGRFEIASTILADFGYEPLPKYTEPTEGPLGNPALAKEYPLVFNSGARPHTDFRSQHHGIKGLVRDNPEPTVELNLSDARQRGIEAGDLVEVRSPRGAVRFRARTSEDIVRGAVECNMGGGTPVGPKAWRTANVNELTDIRNFDEISGFPVYKALLCEVVKVEAATADHFHQRGIRVEQPGPQGSGIRAARPRHPHHHQLRRASCHARDLRVSRGTGLPGHLPRSGPVRLARPRAVAPGDDEGDDTRLHHDGQQRGRHHPAGQGTVRHRP